MSILIDNIKNIYVVLLTYSYTMHVSCVIIDSA